MWYLIQHSNNERVALSASHSYERLEFMLIHRYKRVLPHCNYEIVKLSFFPVNIHSEHIHGVVNMKDSIIDNQSDY